MQKMRLPSSYSKYFGWKLYYGKQQGLLPLELKDVNEPLDSYIERISQSIPQREVRTQYRKVFCVDNLREV